MNTGPATLARVLLALVIGLLIVPAGGAQSLPQPVADLIAGAKAQIRTIDMQTFKARFDRKALGLIIDVREPAEYAQGHIPGAINIPRGVIEFKIWSYVGFPDKLDMREQITLYCGSGARCVLATKSLQDLGLKNVVAADMSMQRWAGAGYPLVRD